MSEQKSPPKATITLEGAERDAFEAIRGHMTRSLPGIAPNNADVMRHALHIAVTHVKEMNSNA